VEEGGRRGTGPDPGWLVNLAGSGTTAAARRLRPGRPTRGKGMGDGGWPGGAHVAVAWRGGVGPARASTRTLPRPGPGPRLLCLVRVARSFAVALQRLQGRMRGSSAAGASPLVSSTSSKRIATARFFASFSRAAKPPADA